MEKKSTLEEIRDLSDKLYQHVEQRNNMPFSRRMDCDLFQAIYIQNQLIRELLYILEKKL